MKDILRLEAIQIQARKKLLTNWFFIVIAITAALVTSFFFTKIFLTSEKSLGFIILDGFTTVTFFGILMYARYFYLLEKQVKNRIKECESDIKKEEEELSKYRSDRRLIAERKINNLEIKISIANETLKTYNEQIKKDNQRDFSELILNLKREIRGYEKSIEKTKRKKIRLINRMITKSDQYIANKKSRIVYLEALFPKIKNL